MIGETDVRAVIKRIAFMTPLGDTFRSNDEHGSSALHMARNSVIALEPPLICTSERHQRRDHQWQLLVDVGAALANHVFRV